jgi:hypothetical protein
VSETTTPQPAETTTVETEADLIKRNACRVVTSTGRSLKYAQSLEGAEALIVAIRRYFVTVDFRQRFQDLLVSAKIKSRSEISGSSRASSTDKTERGIIMHEIAFINDRPSIRNALRYVREHGLRLVSVYEIASLIKRHPKVVTSDEIFGPIMTMEMPKRDSEAPERVAAAILRLVHGSVELEMTSVVIPSDEIGEPGGHEEILLPVSRLLATSDHPAGNDTAA